MRKDFHMKCEFFIHRLCKGVNEEKSKSEICLSKILFKFYIIGVLLVLSLKKVSKIKLLKISFELKNSILTID